jgi:hypothetical protein
LKPVGSCEWARAQEDMLFAGNERALLKRKKKKGKKGNAAKQERARRDAARRQQNNVRLEQARRGHAAVVLQAFARTVS